MTRCVADAAVMLTAIAGFDPRDPTTRHEPVPDYLASLSNGVGGLTIGLDEAYCRDHTDAAVADAVLESVEVFQSLGATIREIQLPPMDDLLRGFVSLVAVEAVVEHEPYYPARAEEYGEGLRQLLEGGRAASAADYARVQAAGRKLSAQLDDLLRGVDAVLCPSWPEPAPSITRGESEAEKIEESGDRLKFTAPYNFSGHPTLSVPCGFSDGGLPLSLQLVGRHLSEDVLLRLGHAYEHATDWHTRHPEL
jgi:amidase